MYHFVVNPIAKGGKLNKEWPSLEKEINKKISNYEVHFTSYRGHATEIAKELSSTTNPTSIIIVGGDGTVNEVINGIINHEAITIGYIPFGSGMDFARGNKIPLDTNKAIDIIVKGNIKSIKYSKIVGDHHVVRCFASNCGIGFDAAVSSDANIEKTYMKKLFNKMNLGTLTYVYFVIKHLFTFKRLYLQLQVDGKEMSYKNSWFITFCNHPYVGGGMKMNPAANASERILDATIAYELSSGQVFAIFPTIFKGNHINHKGVTLLRGKEYLVKSDRAIEAHVDGEVIGTFKEFKVVLNEDSLNLYV